MLKNSKIGSKRSWIPSRWIWIPVAAAAIFGLLNLTDFYSTLEKRVYDTLLHFKPAIAEDPSILLLDVDDTAIANVGVWPWSREIMAEGLITMKEFGADYAVFDIEYTEQSPRGINSTLLQETIPRSISTEFNSFNQNVQDLFTALRNRQISLKDAEDYAKQLATLTEKSKKQLVSEIQGVVRDNDTFLGQAARIFGNAYFTINMLPSGKENIPPELRNLAKSKLALPRVQANAPIPYTTSDIRPAIEPILKGAAGAGFPNVEVDSDGVRRRLYLILEYQGSYYPQLAFSALYKKIGEPDISIDKNRILLKGAVLPTKGKRDISIPLAENGTVLINWPKKTYWNSFRHLSYWNLELVRRQEAALIKGLQVMDEANYLAYNPKGHFLDLYKQAQALRESMLAGGDLNQIASYRTLRSQFFQEAADFLSGPAEAAILADVDQALAQRDISPAQREEFQQVRQDTTDNFANLKELMGNLLKTRETLAANLTGAFCIIGNTATSTTDLGVNPFVKKYENTGTHASIANTLLQASFLDELPWGYSFLIALVLAILLYVLLQNLEALPSILVGLAFAVVVFGAGTAFFVATGTYIRLLTPTLTVLSTFVALAFIKFLKTAQEKSYIRKAFGHYLSTEVINQLITDPDKLRLGGEKKNMTAMFTDIRGFSTISESLDPTDLVRLLNEYLSAMSDIILDLQGTIDKYEGDAIISFFGAPLEMADHAQRGCLAAIRMKKLETELNRRFQEQNTSPAPLFTRIGINTGDMVVGNMGTLQKMDYTIMGNSVNLAARLEGVNKQYGTWILTSEYTADQTGGDFIYRKLDRVRVVGITTPVRLFEVVDEKSQVSESAKEVVDRFNDALNYFEAKDWVRAKKSFEEILKINPEDGPAQTFVKRCETYLKTPPPDTWDGVFNLTAK